MHLSLLYTLFGFRVRTLFEGFPVGPGFHKVWGNTLQAPFPLGKVK